MRADGGSRTKKTETTRVVGIGMMIAGVLAFGFAIAGYSSAGATGTAQPAHRVCESPYGTGTTGQVAGAIHTGCNETTTTWNEQCGCSTTTTTMHKPPCTCSTTSSSSTSTSIAGNTTLYTTIDVELDHDVDDDVDITSTTTSSHDDIE